MKNALHEIGGSKLIKYFLIAIIFVGLILTGIYREKTNFWLYFTMIFIGIEAVFLLVTKYKKNFF